jgi:hypothetical protein
MLNSAVVAGFPDASVILPRAAVGGWPSSAITEQDSMAEPVALPFMSF